MVRSATQLPSSSLPLTPTDQSWFSLAEWHKINFSACPAKRPPSPFGYDPPLPNRLMFFFGPQEWRSPLVTSFATNRIPSRRISPPSRAVLPGHMPAKLLFQGSRVGFRPEKSSRPTPSTVCISLKMLNLFFKFCNAFSGILF